MPPAAEPDWQPMLDQHGLALLMLARQILHTPAAAEDAVQEGFVRFWKSRAHAREPIGYLYACVRTAALDLLRFEKRRHQHVAQIENASHSTASPDSILQSPAESNERCHSIEEALTALPAEQREVLIMKIWGDLTFAQIAAALSISINTAAARYRYALEKLETKLSREMTYE